MGKWCFWASWMQFQQPPFAKRPKVVAFSSSPRIQLPPKPTQVAGYLNSLGPPHSHSSNSLIRGPMLSLPAPPPLAQKCGTRICTVTLLSGLEYIVSFSFTLGSGDAIFLAYRSSTRQSGCGNSFLFKEGAAGIAITMQNSSDKDKIYKSMIDLEDRGVSS